jgi:hypothetical protein
MCCHGTRDVRPARPSMTRSVRFAAIQLSSFTAPGSVIHVVSLAHISPRVSQKMPARACSLKDARIDARQHQKCTWGDFRCAYRISEIPTFRLQCCYIAPTALPCMETLLKSTPLPGAQAPADSSHFAHSIKNLYGWDMCSTHLAATHRNLDRHTTRITHSCVLIKNPMYETEFMPSYWRRVRRFTRDGGSTPAGTTGQPNAAAQVPLPHYAQFTPLYAHMLHGEASIMAAPV